jgi:FkbM family methyltransferase
MASYPVQWSLGVLLSVNNELVQWAFSALRPLVNRVLPRHPIPVRVLAGPARGIRLLIDPQVEKFYWRGAHDSAVAKALIRFLKPGDVFWDIGAHIGYTSLLASRLVGPTGHVHAFEPLPENLVRLHEGIRLNRATNVVVHPVAVSDTVGHDSFVRHESSLMGSLVGQGEIRERVAVTTMDTLLATTDPPNLIKIDVEGAESRVLAGAVRVISQHPIVILEMLGDTHRIGAILQGWQFQRLDHHNWLATHLR